MGDTAPDEVNNHPTEDDTPSPPDSVWTQLTDDGGVLKRVIRAGTGAVPTAHARCFVHYVGRCVGEDAAFIDTRAEAGEGQQPVPLVAGRDTCGRERGLHIAAAHMRKGELAQLRLQPDYGYGAAGSFSFPAVPPNAALEYDIELIDFDDVREDKDRGEMLYEERLEAAERRRMDGNKLFADEQYKEAVNMYSTALYYVDEDFMMQLEGKYLDQAQAVRLPIHLNMAACQLQYGDYATAIHNCSVVLQTDADNVKAWFRRGRAKHALGQTEGAHTDLREALKRSPDDGAVMKELKAVQQTMKAEREAQARLFRGRLQESPGALSMPNDAPSTAPSQQAQNNQQASSTASGYGSMLLQWLAAWWHGLVQLMTHLLSRTSQPSTAAHANTRQ